MAKPNQTATDYIVMALSPALIMALVGSLCFFLMDVRFQGVLDGSLSWVMFWFVLGIVLISRISIEEGWERASVFVLALGATLWLYLLQNSPAYLLGVVLMTLVWYCANKLVWDCTLIDDDEDSSGEGLLQKKFTFKFWEKKRPDVSARSAKPLTPNSKADPKRKRKAPRRSSESPGRSVVYFSVLALPLFGIGQMILPTTGDARQLGFRLLAIYLAAALGLLVTTSFLGLRRYLRQRYLPMPPSIAFAWVKFGGGVAIFVLIACMLLPRPGATVVWSQLQVKVDDQLRSVTKAVSRQKVASDSNTSEKNGRNSGNRQGDVKGGSGQSETKSGDAAPATPSNGPQLPSAQPAGQIYYLLRNSLLAIGGLLVAWWLYRSRYLLLEIWRAIVTAFHNFCYVPKFKSTRPKDEEVSFRPRRPLADFQNPFLTTAENMRPPEEVILYTYEALQAWSFEQGMQPEPEKTSREFCQQMSSRLPEIGWALQHLAYLHAHAAYGKHLPTDCNLEPLKEIWRCLTWK